jgi:hypothetical protein
MNDINFDKLDTDIEKRKLNIALTPEKEAHIKKVLGFIYNIFIKQERLLDEETLWIAYVSSFQKPLILNRNGFSIVYQEFKNAIESEA